MFFVLSKLAFLVLRPSNLIILMMIAGLAAPRFGRRRTGPVLFWTAFVALVALAWTPLSTVLMEPLEKRFPIVETLPEPPTGIIVLGGTVDTVGTAKWRDQPQMLDGAERLLLVAGLARRYPNARIVFTGGSAAVLMDEPSEAWVADKVFAAMGLPRDRLILEDKSRNTRENAAFSYDLVQPQPGERWLLVTSAFHMPRSVGVFRAAGWPGITAYPVDFRTVGALKVMGRQYASEGLFIADIAVREWLGLAAYRFMGYTDALFPEP
ncbi:YdcF family protein [Chthonobacter albigriseus]|uniref:YdcF family protein n=1 Tax=Chthonobacter albigriseus TaxID=1683161 RepID=UPI0015EF2B1C|nr:YdcF family protein [Chthonobacter albigriseus]